MARVTDLFTTSVPLGVLTSMNYQQAVVASSDERTAAAGGVPLNCFLLAAPGTYEDPVRRTGFTPRDGEAVLLSVQGVVETDADLRRLKEELAHRGEEHPDAMTKQRLQVIGYSCRVVGTFYEREDGTMVFGSDVDRVFSLTSYQVFRPRGASLSALASYTRPYSGGETADPAVQVMNVGTVRYSETDRNPDAEAKVFLDIRDFVGKKTALFGMSRTGKSNSIKVIVQQVFDYSKKADKKIGQLIFDPQGEYANPNSQDASGESSASALSEMGQGEEVTIFRTQRRLDAKQHQELLLINFLEEDNLELLWNLMLAELQNGMSSGANYTAGLRSLDFERPGKTPLEGEDGGAFHKRKVHYTRKRLALYAFLKLARITGPVKNLVVNVGKDNVDLAVQEAGHGLTASKFKEGEVFVPTVDAAYALFRWILAHEDGVEEEVLQEDLEDGALLPPPSKGRKGGEDTRRRAVLSDSWREDLKEGDLSEFKKQFDAVERGRTGVVAAFTRLRELHTTESAGDLREKVWKHLAMGRLVIVDLSRGSGAVTTALSELIVTSIMDHASERFVSGLPSVPIQIVVEEAHNLFRREGVKDDAVDPWVRLSKEAAKYDIGLLYATQEITSVDPRILSNSANWIVGHLNSSKELRELSGYYSFGDWTDSLKKSESKGFVRMKTESSPFIVPVQMARFVARRD